MIGALVLVGHASSHAAASAGATDVTFVSAAKVAAAFEKGTPLVETTAYKVHASRREGPGMAEVHVRDTDIIYVLQGTATLITGGDVVDRQTVATDEIRGSAIRGGEPQTLVKGDVFIVPNGVPHLFKDVSAPFLYYVVKTTDWAGGTR
jgi:glc operon protein GlcG